MSDNLRILQLNIWRSKAGMEALINDPKTNDLDILLIQEPPVSAYATHVNHRLWQLYKPTHQDEEVRNRSVIYVNKRIATSGHRQIQCNSPDVTAVQVWTDQVQMLIFSVYIPPIKYRQISEEISMQTTLNEIEKSIRSTKDTSKSTRLTLAGDFNRHHPAWSNQIVNTFLLRHAEELLSFIQELGLQWCLPSGTPTYWSHSQPGRNSTIDLTLTDTPEKVLKCQLYHDNYGSDHRGTFSEWDLQPLLAPTQRSRRAFDRAEWDNIGKCIQTAIDPSQEIRTKTQLEERVNKLIQATSIAVEEHTPLTRSSPYSKRWFTPDLKTQQREVNKTRRTWQESCASKGKDHPHTRTLFTEMSTKRRVWTRTIGKVKATHWKEFLDTASAGNLWKAAKYMGPRDNYANIPPLIVGEHEIAENNEKAQILLESFFPKMADPIIEDITPTKEEITWDPITGLEIERALKAARGNTAPGEDNLPTLVWKNTWKYISQEITKIFTASINLGHYPRKWKTAKIIVLRKPGKPDYALPGAYRPISLLNTLGKVLEAVVARRLSYYAEKFKLLPDTQFGGRPGRTTEQALLILTNAIDRAWLKSKMITLVAFDLKGAFNGVNKHTLEARLKENGIPTIARRWIQSFMEDREASIKFDDFETEVKPLENAGLAQGSPLSPILFAFFNSDLVNQPVNYKGGSSASIDDYCRWRAGRTAEENIKQIQDEDIPRIEAWAKKTGSIFAAEKTELIHLTRKKKELGKGEIKMSGETIKASPKAKLLGVVFDQELRWKLHVQQIVKRATRTALSMGGLRHLRPLQMTQLYQACVTPKMDYASTVWHNPGKDKMHLRSLNAVQRTAMLKILSAFRTVATEALEVESFVPPTDLRLKKRAQNVIANLYTLPQDHPIQKVLEQMKGRCVLKGDPGKLPLATSINTLEPNWASHLETINPNPLKPWRQETFESITIAASKEKAVQQINKINLSEIVIYTDASEKKTNLGAAVVLLNHQNKIERFRRIGIGSKTHWSIHAAELIAIHHAIVMAHTIIQESETDSQEKSVTIASDRRSALQSIQNPANKPGQHIIHSILQSAEELKAKGAKIKLLWIPAHQGIAGNEIADKLAKTAINAKETHQFHR